MEKSTANTKPVSLSDHLDEDTIGDLIGPVCQIADMNRDGKDGDWNLLIEAARRIQQREGFAVRTFKL